MGCYFSDKTEEGVRLVWMQYETKKIREGQSLLQACADGDDADACCFAGCTYMGPQWVWKAARLPADPEKGMALMEKGARLGSACGALACLLAGKKLTPGEMPFASIGEAYHEALEKARSGSAVCQCMIGVCAYKVESLQLEADIFAGSEEASSGEDARSWFEKALHSGLSGAMKWLDLLYQKSGSDPCEDHKYIELVQEAAQYGDPVWQNALAKIFCRQDKFEDALKLYERAARGGESDAWYHIGLQYEHGKGASKNYAKAVWAYTLGTKAGCVEAKTALGKCFLLGKGTAKQPEQAYNLFAEAASEDNDIAKLYLGHCLLYGTGTAKNPDKGVEFLTDALNYNFPNEDDEHPLNACDENIAIKPRLEYADRCRLYLDLGDAFENGLGIEQDDNAAGVYFSLLADEDDKTGIEKLSNYRKRFGKWKRIK